MSRSSQLIAAVNPPTFSPPDWSGRTAVVIASGPSLTLTDLRHLARARFEKGLRAVAINDAVFVAWWVDWLHACDEKWWGWNKCARAFPGKRTSVEPVDGVERMIDSGVEGYDERPGYVRNGKSGLYQVIHALIQSNVAKIMLVGCDLKASAEGSHYFGEHKNKVKPNFDVMFEPFETLKAPLATHGVSVVNCSGNSALTAFPRATLDDLKRP